MVGRPTHRRNLAHLQLAMVLGHFGIRVNIQATIRGATIRRITWGVTEQHSQE